MQMVDCFLQSDVVISAGGQTCNELVQLKTPSVLLTVADNQSNNVKAMTEGGFALSLLATEVERDLVPTLQQMTYDVRYAMYKKMCPLDFSNGARQIIKDSIASSGR